MGDLVAQIGLARTLVIAAPNSGIVGTMMTTLMNALRTTEKLHAKHKKVMVRAVVAQICLA